MVARVGVLALQGAFDAHVQRFRALGADAFEVRTVDDLARVDAVALPGGESTTMSRLLVSSGVFDALGGLIRAGLPVFGTCAGMILLATDVLDGRPDQVGFGAIDITVRRNAYGRQVDSFEADLSVAGLDSPFHAVFIRAPVVERAGPGVVPLATHEGRIVLAQQGAITVASFHPELTEDVRLHARFLEEV